MPIEYATRAQRRDADPELTEKHLSSMSESFVHQSQAKLTLNRTKRLIVLALVALMAVTTLLRVWRLNTVPPGLFGDEAQSGVDVQAWLRGQSTQLFPHHLGGEVLYGYLSVPFIALWDGTPLGIRLVAALAGVLMIPALFGAGRALWQDRPRLGVLVGLIAAALWMVNYWPQSVNRIGFQVNTQPLMLTLAVVAWLSWTQRPSRWRAVTWGVLAALTLYTYPAARITMALWPLLYVALLPAQRRQLRATLLWAVGAFVVAVAPLATHFILHPYYFTYRAAAFSALHGALPWSERIRLWAENARQVAGVYLGGPGDPDPRHNLPGRAPFAPYLAGLLVAGTVLALAGLCRREQRSWTLLLWLAVLSVPAVAAGDANPHFLRLLGALPAALLLIAWPIASLLTWSRRRSCALAVGLATLLVLLIVVEGTRSTRDYFVRWATHTDLYYTYQVDVWNLGERIASTPGGIGVVPVDPTMLPDFVEHSLQYGFPGTPILQIQVREGEIARWLQEQLGDAVGSKIVTPIWHEGPETGADAKGLLLFYLGREGKLINQEALRGYDVLTFALDQPPQFLAEGNSVTLDQTFSSAITLTAVRWGAAYPNPERNSTTAAAGTRLWAILTWRLEQPSPNLTATLDLVDGAGHRLASSETFLLDDQRRPVSQWEVGTVGRSYHLVELPETLLPGEILLESRIYDSQTLLPLLPRVGTPRQSTALATAEITPAATNQADSPVAVAQPVGAALAQGITLLGLDPFPAQVAPGQTLTLRLLWQLVAPLSEPQTYLVSLDDTNARTKVVLPLNTPARRTVHTYVDLHLPPDLTSGVYNIKLMSQGSTSAVLLGQVAVVGRLHLFEVPPLEMPLKASFGDAVSLVGVNGLSGNVAVKAGESLRFSLVWQAWGTPQQNLVRFVHLRGPDGRVVAQQDTVPCLGACLASSWLSEEILVDEVEVVLPADLPPGDYSLAIGWYDTATPMQRLAARDANGWPLKDDLCSLPVRVSVAP